jgi:cytochrome c1
MIAGRLGNSPDNLQRWIRDPQAVSPGTAMPDLNVGERDARDITAFLYTRD